ENVSFCSQLTGNDPQYIAVYCRNSLPKGDGGHGASSIVSDTTEVQQLVTGGGNLATVQGHHLFGSFLQIPDPAVIAQSLPELVKQRFFCFGQRCYVGQRLQKTVIVGYNRFHPSLLQHD